VICVNSTVNEICEDDSRKIALQNQRDNCVMRLLLFFFVSSSKLRMHTCSINPFLLLLLLLVEVLEVSNTEKMGKVVID
jgi:hypothetical protein